MSLENFPEKHRATFEEMEQSLGDPELLRLPVDLEKLSMEIAENEGLKRLVDSTLRYCERYTESVAAYQELLLDEKKDNADIMELDKTQRLVHNATIDAINILARGLAKAGYDASWVSNLKSRADYGKLALLTTYRILERQLPTEKGGNEDGKED